MHFLVIGLGIAATTAAAGFFIKKKLNKLFGRNQVTQPIPPAPSPQPTNRMKKRWQQQAKPTPTIESNGHASMLPATPPSKKRRRRQARSAANNGHSNLLTGS